jgi:hypothetical protein
MGRGTIAQGELSCTCSLRGALWGLLEGRSSFEERAEEAVRRTSAPSRFFFGPGAQQNLATAAAS